jgi:putative membrane protein
MLRGFLIRWVVNAVALWLTSVVIPGIVATSIGATFLAALVLGILNAFVRPVLILLTLPINLLTLGLFTFVINALLLKLAGSLVDGFAVHGFFSAFFGAILLSVISFFLSAFVSDEGRFAHVYVETRRY